MSQGYATRSLENSHRISWLSFDQHTDGHIVIYDRASTEAAAAGGRETSGAARTAGGVKSSHFIGLNQIFTPLSAQQMLKRMGADYIQYPRHIGRFTTTFGHNK
jgi:hypothetical protein